MAARRTLFLLLVTAVPLVVQAQFVESNVRIIHDLRGPSRLAAFGLWINDIGDADGDRVDDLVVGAPDTAAGAGAAYLYSGRSGQLLIGKSSPVVRGQFGASVSAAGDIDGDGAADFIVGAPGAASLAGAAFVYSGREGSLLRTHSGLASADQLGFAVATAGDLNGDGTPDLLVGAIGSNAEAGAVYVYSGRDGTTLRTLSGLHPGDHFGSGVNPLGDVTGDGVSDFVVGAMDAPPDHRGRAYVYNGATGALLYEVPGDATSQHFGWAFVCSAGDVNRDGRPDLLIGDFGNDAPTPSAGRAWLYNGPDGTLIHRFDGQPGNGGFGVARGAGDVNNDGYGDLLIAAYDESQGAPQGGKVFVYSGKDYSVLKTITGNVDLDQLGVDVAPMGDVDGDGSLDFAMSAPGADVNGAASGRVYVVSGETIPKTPAGSILSPLAGASLPNGGTLQFELRNVTLDCGLGSANVAGHVHVRIEVDGELDSEVCSASASLKKSYAAGPHTLRIMLVNNDGTPLSPPVEASVTVTIVPNIVFVDKALCPGVARAAGSAAFFRTSLWMANPGAAATTVRLRFVPGTGFPPAGAAESVVADIPAGQMVAYHDVLSEAFHVTGDSGGVVVVGVGEGMSTPLITARTYNDTAGGTFGQYIEAVPIPGGAAESWLHGLAGNAGSRSNVGIVNVSSEALSGALTLWDEAGSQAGGELPVTVGPWSSLQVNRVNAAVGVPESGNFSVRVRSAAGHAFVYGSKLDNITSDPIFVIALPARSRQWIDGIGAVAGAGGTFFRSSLLVSNRGEQPAVVRIGYTRRGETAESRHAEVLLAGGESKVFGDTVAELYGLQNTAGTLSLTTDAATPVVAWARTFNDRGAAGTLGQFIPSFGSENLIGEAGAVLQGLSENEQVRTNLGMVNTAAAAADVTLRAFSAAGVELAAKTYRVEGGQAVQVGRVLIDLGLSAASDVYLTVRPGVNGAVYAWASYVDNRSTDQTFVRPVVPR